MSQNAAIGSPQRTELSLAPAGNRKTIPQFPARSLGTVPTALHRFTIVTVIKVNTFVHNHVRTEMFGEDTSELRLIRPGPGSLSVVS